MRGNTAALVLSSTALLAAAAALWNRGGSTGERDSGGITLHRALEERVAALERREAGDRSGASADGRAADGVAKPTDGPAVQPPGIGDGAGARILDARGDGVPEPLRALVRKEVAAEWERRAKEAGDPEKEKDGKASLATVAAQLGLDEAQRQAMERELRNGQEAMLALLKQPASDGTVFADRIADAFLVPQERMGGAFIEVFAAMAATEVPGTGQTYALRAEGVQKSIREALKRELPPDRYRAFEALGKDPTDIEIPDSPWMEILAEAHRRSRGKDGAER